MAQPAPQVRESLFSRFNPFATIKDTIQPLRNTATPFFSNIGKGATEQTKGFFQSFPTVFGPSTSTGTIFGKGDSSSDITSKIGVFAHIASYIFGILIVILILLIFVHFLISPIFQLHPGGPGIIPIPGGDDGVLFWKDAHPFNLSNSQLPISNQSYGYSMILDVFIENPLRFSSNFRLLFRRSDVEVPTTSISGGTLEAYLNNYNVAAALHPSTNDLQVSVLCTDGHPYNVNIENVPVQEPFRLGIIVMEKALEVYINGKLMKTQMYSSPPKDVKGNIYPKIGSDSSVAKIQNLKIWNRILTTSEMRYAKPPMPSASAFSAEPIPSSGGCQ